MVQIFALPRAVVRAPLGRLRGALCVIWPHTDRSLREGVDHPHRPPVRSPAPSPSPNPCAAQGSNDHNYCVSARAVQLQHTSCAAQDQVLLILSLARCRDGSGYGQKMTLPSRGAGDQRHDLSHAPACAVQLQHTSCAVQERPLPMISLARCRDGSGGGEQMALSSHGAEDQRQYSALAPARAVRLQHISCAVQVCFPCAVQGGQR